MNYDAVVLGSGSGGGTITRALAERGKRVLLIERGEWLPSEPANWDARQVFENGRYKTTETWQDGNGKPFTPGEYYWVGGKTKFYGAALFRMHAEDLQSWAASEEIASYYERAERMYGVRTLPHVPVIQRVSDVFEKAGLHPENAPCAVLEGKCIQCHACDGFACPLHAKGDAETCAVRPALETGNVTLMTGTKVTRLVRGASGEIVSLECVNASGERDTLDVSGIPVILAAGAVNSAALWLTSNLPDSSGQAGRNYMCHLSQAVLATGREKLPPGFHKSLVVKDWYYRYGSVQMAGQPQASMLRGESRIAKYAGEISLREIAQRSVCFWLMTEDIPAQDNRVTVEGGKIRVTYKNTRAELRASESLYGELRKHLPAMGFHGHLRKRMPLSAVAHQCGTLRMGNDPASSVVSASGESWEVPGLYVADASVFPSSSAVNPALTVMANSIRVADHILER